MTTNLYEGLPIISWPVHPQRTRARRPGEGAPHTLVLHTSEQAFVTMTSAENLARAIGSPPVTTNGRINQASYHWAVDLDTIASLVPPDDIAYHAPPNWHGEAICLTGRAARDWTGTTDGVDDWPELRLAAELAGRRCWARGWPVRRLTVDQLRSGARGLCGHVDISHTFGKTDHTDPGAGFPWPAFLDLVADEVDRLTDPDQEEFMKARRVFVANDPTRAEALVMIDMRGFDTPAERDTVVEFYEATDKALTPAQYDALLEVAQD